MVRNRRREKKEKRRSDAKRGEARRGRGWRSNLVSLIDLSRHQFSEPGFGVGGLYTKKQAEKREREKGYQLEARDNNRGRKRRTKSS